MIAQSMSGVESKEIVLLCLLEIFVPLLAEIFVSLLPCQYSLDFFQPLLVEMGSMLIEKRVRWICCEKKQQIYREEVVAREGEL